MSLSDAIRRLFSPPASPNSEYSEPAQVHIVNVEQTSAHPIPAPTSTIDQIDWLRVLEIPYERWDMRVPQIKAEVHKMYVSLAEFIDNELQAYDTSLWELRNRLNQSYGYYNNILYTIYCIAEGEVTHHYKPSASYDNGFSYDLLTKHTNEEFCNRVKQFSKNYCTDLPKADEETRAAYHLTSNGLEMVWWDMDGSLRERHKLSEMHINLLNKTPARTTNMLQIAEVRAYVLMQYMATLGVLKKEFESAPGWSKKMSAHLNSFFKDVPFYRWDYGGDFKLLGYLLKLCEQTIRENVPYARPLKIEEEIAHIKRVLPKAVAEKVLHKTTALSKPITLSDESIEALRKQNPHAWKTDILDLGKHEVQRSLGILNYYRNDEEFYRIAKEAIKQTAGSPVHLIAFYAYYVSLPVDKEDFATKRKLHQFITHPEQQKKFEELVAKRLPLDLNLVQTLGLLTKPPVRTVKLDSSKLSIATAEHEEALKSVSGYLGEEEAAQPRVAETSDNKDAISIEDLFGSTPSEADIKFTPDQLELLKIIRDGGWNLPTDQAEVFAKSKHKLLRGFIQEVNKRAYDGIEDQLLIQSDDKITVDNIYRDFVKETLDGRPTA